jgi:hypothetical protein
MKKLACQLTVSVVTLLVLVMPVMLPEEMRLMTMNLQVMSLREV